MKPTVELSSSETLANLATTIPGASRAFARRGLDYCCRGQVPLAEACAKKGIDADEVIEEIRAGAASAEPLTDWSGQPIPAIVQHIVDFYHARLRQELPELLRMAERVEHVHGDKESCPRGLAQRLRRAQFDVQFHLEKEESILFPLLCSGQGNLAAEPIRVMEHEHEDHAAMLAELRGLTGDHVPPPEACATWRALYLRLADFDREFHDHVHLENHVLFPKALNAS